MQQVIQCPRCAQRYQAAAEWAGRSTNCPACGTPIAIPAPPQLQPIKPLAPLSPFDQPRQVPQQAAYSPPPAFMQQPAGNGVSPMVWVAIGGGVIAVFFVFTLVIFAMGRSSSTPATVAQAQPPESFAPANAPAAKSSDPPSWNSSVGPRPIDTLPKTPETPRPIPREPLVNPTLPTPEPASQPAASNTPATPAEWGNKPEPKPAATTSSDKPKAPAQPAVEFGSQILIDERGGITFGPAGCPVAVTGNQVWDIDARKVRAELVDRTESRGLAVLSPDGNWFAAAGKSPNQQDTEVVVWNTKTGEQEFSVPGNEERFVDTMYLSDKQLFLGGRDNSSIEVWDLETAEGKKIDIPDARLGRGKVGFTLDGSYLAVPVKDRLTVFRTSTGKMAAYMGTPKPSGRLGWDATFVYAWLQSLEFSADSLELAGVSTHPSPRVMCWDNRGKLVFDQPYYVDDRAFWENTLQWFPNRQAWLIESDVFDRTTGKIVLSIRKSFAQTLYTHVHDDDHLVGTFPSNPQQLEVLEIPWEKIRASQEAMKTKQPALLSPALPVALLLELGELRGDKAEVSQLIETALTERLKRDGFTVSRQGTTYFRVKFAESAGDTLPIFERQRFEWGRGRDTGRTATESKGDLVVELFVVGRADPIWRDTMKVTSSSSFNEEINDATIRKSMLDRAAHAIRKLNFPYYIPESEEMVALPILVQ